MSHQTQGPVFGKGQGKAGEGFHGVLPTQLKNDLKAIVPYPKLYADGTNSFDPGYMKTTSKYGIDGGHE